MYLFREKFKIIIKALLIGFFFIVQFNAISQNLNYDSLVIEYESKNFSKQKELYILEQLSMRSNNPKDILKYALILIERAKALDSTKKYLFSAKQQIGHAYLLKSDVSKALDAYLDARKIALSEGYSSEEAFTKKALVDVTIGDVYSDIGEYDRAVSYYEDAVIGFKKSNDKSLALAGALLNYGDASFNAGYYDKALGLFFESIGICNAINYKIGTAYNLGNIGMVYAKQNKSKLAEANINEAIQILEEYEDYYAISVYLDYMSKIYTNSEQPTLALNFAKRSLFLAKKYELKDEISKANLTLANIYEKVNKLDSSLYHLREYVKYKDSLSASIKKLSNKTTELEVSKKQVEVDLLTQKSQNEKIVMYSFMGGLILVSGLAFGLFRRNRFINKTKKIIDEEKQKSDSLLLNILPKETADELKNSGKVQAKKYESVTVLFTDFKGFTKIAENSAPEKLVESVDMYFSEFDKIMAKYKLEKIKTIGDSYMCAGGIPEQTDNHADLMAKAAIEIRDFVKKSKQVYAVNDVRFDVRIGIHTGPVVAGVVGKYKFSYDIWGDTVNVASRIESSCEPGKISVSEDTYKLINDQYLFEDRGEISIKNRSSLKMYYLNSK